MGKPYKTVIFVALGLLVLIAGIATSWSKADYQREDLRLFYTAPPVIPHEVDDEVGDTCMMCHADVAELGDRVSVPTPHPQFTNCLQCHLTSHSHDGQEAAPIDSSWVGLEEPEDGVRITETAPPTIPHRLFLRDNCLSCHHPQHPRVEQRCDHPQRTNCRQCHIADSANEFIWK